jgi:hypothetical protein
MQLSLNTKNYDPRKNLCPSSSHEITRLKLILLSKIAQIFRLVYVSNLNVVPATI